MPVIYDATTKDDRMLAVRDRVGGGDMQVLSEADVVLATFALTAEAGSVASASWTLGFVNLTVAASAAGDVAKARIRDSVAAVRVSGLTAGLVGTDIIVNAVEVVQGQNVTVSSGTINHAPDPT